MLNGMFAIFIYDIRFNKFLLFRDHMGIKPLFYSLNNDILYFSSDLNGLSKVLASNLSELGIISYLGLSYVSKPKTIYSNINKLSPGSSIIIENNSINTLLV